MKQQLLLLFIVSILFTNCGSSKKVSELEVLPEWALSRPVVPGYYVGIASVKKVGTSNEYIRKAREAAMADLASEIAVTVNSSSVLHTVSDELNMSETLYTRNELKATDYLDGFEPVANYDGLTDYWVYYQIDKQVYEQKKQERIDKAVDLALKSYSSGLKYDEQLKPEEAFMSYLQGLEHLKEYLHEPVFTTYNGSEIDLGNELLKHIRAVMEGVKITPLKDRVQIQRGRSYDDPIGFMVVYQKEPVKDIRIDFSYTDGYLDNSTGKTGSDGICYVQLGKVSSTKASEKLTASIDYTSIVREAVKDVFIRGMMKRMVGKEAFCTIEVKTPIIKLQVSSEGAARPFDEKPIEEITRNMGGQYGFDVHQGKVPTAYQQQISYSFKSLTGSAGLYAVLMDAKVSIMDESGKVLAKSEENEIKGIGKSVAEAQNNAYKELLQTLQLRLLPQVWQQVFSE